MFRSTPRPAPDRNRIIPSLLEFEERITPIIQNPPEFYVAERGSVLNIPASEGVLANDFSTVDYGAVLRAQLITGPVAIGTSRALPPDTLTLNPDGSFTLIVPGDEFPDRITRIGFDYFPINLNDPTERGVGGVAGQPPGSSVVIDIIDPSADYLVTGVDSGSAPLVNIYHKGTGEIVRSFLAYEPSFTGGVRVATGDVDLDGIDDIVTVPGVGGSALVKVFSGVDGSLIYSGQAFDPNFRGGASVAVADVDADGEREIIVGAGEGGGPVVAVIDFSVNRTVTFPNTTFVLFENGQFNQRLNFTRPSVTQFFAYDPSVRTGVEVATADIDGPDRGLQPPPGINTAPTARKTAEYILTVPGKGGAPHVKAFDFTEVRRRITLNRQFDSTLSFYAGDGTNYAGASITGGDVNGDGFDEIIVGGAGQDFGVVRTFNERGGLLSTITIPVDQVPTSGPISGLYANTKGASGNLLTPGLAPNSLVSTTPGMGVILPNVIRGGIQLGTIDWNGDGIDDLITGSGPGNPPRVRVLDISGTQQPQPVELANFLAYESTFLGGIRVNG